jgi:hypothetical protein
MEPEYIDSLESEDVVDFVDALFDGDKDEHAAVLAACTAAVATSLIGNEDTVGASPFKGRLTGSQSVARGPCRWFQDYLTAQPIYPPHTFRRIFRIPLKLYALLKVEPPIKDHRLLQLENRIRRTHDRSEVVVSFASTRQWLVV